MPAKRKHMSAKEEDTTDLIDGADEEIVSFSRSFHSYFYEFT